MNEHDAARALFTSVHPAMGPKECSRWIAYSAAMLKERTRAAVRREVLGRSYPVAVFDSLIEDIREMHGRVA